MKDKLLDNMNEVEKLHKMAIDKSHKDNFAYALAAQSLESHIDELSVLHATSIESPSFEMLDFRIKAENLQTGSAPLDLVENISGEVRRMIGYAALRIIRGGMSMKRIPKELHNTLDLRLVGILPGSSRFIISAHADRDLFNDGLSKTALERVFSVLDTQGQGEDFLSAVNTLGPSSAKCMKSFFDFLKEYSAEAEFTWKYSGKEIWHWDGTKDVINSVTEALEATKIKYQDEILVHGKIELLSKRERIELRSKDGELIKILYPKNILDQVSELHLEEMVSLKCLLTESENPLTGESSILYELLEIKN